MIGYYLPATIPYVSSHLILLTTCSGGVILLDILYKYGMGGKERYEGFVPHSTTIVTSSRDGDSNPKLSYPKVAGAACPMGKQGDRGVVMALEE